MRENVKRLVALLSLVIVTCFMAGCFQGPMGPQGPAGANGANGTNGTNGINGVNGINGTNASSVCLVCHTTSKFDSITTEYKMSYHFTRGVVQNSNRFCERCHTNEGFQEIALDGLPWAQAAIPMATRIQCETCHEMRGFDFTDTIPCLLRTITPVVLNYNNLVTLSGWGSMNTTDFGQVNNLCGTCHQIRGPTSFVYQDTTSTINGAANAKKSKTDVTFTQLPYFPVSQYAPTDSVAYKNGTTFAVHDGNQTNLQSGMNAYEYPGVSYQGKDTTTWHHLKDDCTDCHILTQFSSVDSTGGHTFRINRKDRNCNVCHNLNQVMNSDSIAVASLLIQLGDLLTARKVMTKRVNTTPGQLPYTYTAVASHDFYGTLYDSTNTGKFYAGTASNNSVAPTTGILTYDNLVTWSKDTVKVANFVTSARDSVPSYSSRIGRKWLGGELGAAYNFAFVQTAIYQHEFGIHNPAYCKSVLQASINWLRSN
jgi:hypothetical protein